MKLRRASVSEDPQTRNSADDHTFPIPIELIIEIFSRLQLKCIARCRCVSKLWACVLGRLDFTELFFTRSSARPRLLFTCKKFAGAKHDDPVLFFSSPQPDDNQFSLAANYHMDFKFSDQASCILSPVSGFFCIQDNRFLKFRKTREPVSVICNPSTGQSFTLPKMKTRMRTCMRSYLGYDPIEKHHKVLTMTYTPERGAGEHQVMTLGTGKLTWRMAECGIPHYSPGPICICINGLLYYIAQADRSSKDHLIVCFDVRSEKYSFIKAVERVMYFLPTLVNYNGKLCSLTLQRSTNRMITRVTRTFEMWVLEDAEKHEWSQHIYKLPPLWKNVVEDNFLHFVGLTGTNEIVLSSNYSSDAFYLYYYNFEVETIRRVGIQGLGSGYGIDTFLNHVDDVKLMKLL
ncbi:unnamed protein product [Microthlaspi erraticum]|uniref:F-box domain-containing protein n=1 Tax=Microthlaspi erraticum TaxID=1685480 RepID=A0A6D2IA59_9BRAS|nr:unnamed protein product [Microthlaspi erraticum]